VRRFAFILLLVAAVVTGASDAFAFVRVVNLSGQPQTVAFWFAGTNTVRTIAPNETAFFRGSEGMLSLVIPEDIARASAAEPGIGGRVFGDVIASNRTSRIPASNGDTFAIWQDGRLLIQRRGVGVSRGGKAF
jgi:hypothetical protein